MTDDQAIWDQEGLCDVARLLVAALEERDQAQASEAAGRHKLEEARQASRDQRAALEKLLMEFREQLPAAEELPDRLGRLREARAEEQRLHKAEADLSIAHADAARRVLKGRLRCTGLIDSLDAYPLIDYALAHAAAAAAEPPPDPTPVGPAAVSPVEEAVPIPAAAEPAPARRRGRPRKAVSP